MSDKLRGLYQKYRVTKVEGETDPKAIYIVLRVDTDIHARLAILLYSTLIAKTYQKLSCDLNRLIHQLGIPAQEA